MSDVGHGARQRRVILDTGVALWARGQEPTPRNIAAKLGMTHGSVLYHFNSVFRLREALAHHAVHIGESRVVLQLIAIGWHGVLTMGDLERSGHLQAVSTNTSAHQT